MTSKTIIAVVDSIINWGAVSAFLDLIRLIFDWVFDHKCLHYTEGHDNLVFCKTRVQCWYRSIPEAAPVRCAYRGVVSIRLDEVNNFNVAKGCAISWLRTLLNTIHYSTMNSYIYWTGVCLLLAIAAALYRPFSAVLSPLWTNKPHTRLHFSPVRLNLLDVALVIAIYIYRSITCSIGLNTTIPDATPPSLTLSMPLILQKRDMAAYIRAVRDKSRTDFDIDINNAQLLLLLSSVTEPAMLLLLAKRGCPIRPLGAVNVRNRFEFLRPDLCKPNTLLKLKGVQVIASLSRAPRKAKRGLEYDIELELSVPEGDDDSRTTVFRQVFTMLQFMHISDPPRPRASRLKSAGFKPSVATVPVTIEVHEPSEWAAVCKDYNPIHISLIAARAFGFKAKIAHGNHMVAKALEVLVRRSPESLGLLNQLNLPIFMEVEFRKPVIVPARLDFRVTHGDGDGMLASFDLLQGEKVAVQGALGKL